LAESLTCSDLELLQLAGRSKRRAIYPLRKELWSLEAEAHVNKTLFKNLVRALKKTQTKIIKISNG
jgi:hypothetical protein